MKTESLVEQANDVIATSPALSVILPFEPKMTPKSTLLQQLQIAADKVERELGNGYDHEAADGVLQKFKTVIANLNFNTHKKSVAIYISPFEEKVLYLDMDVERKVIVGECFEIRDLVLAKKESRRYLVLILSDHKSEVYVANGLSFVKIKTNVQRVNRASQPDAFKPALLSSQNPDRSFALLSRFLMDTDRELKYLIDVFSMPAYVIGPAKMLDCFRVITRNERHLLGYIPGSYEQPSEAQLAAVLKPHVTDWKGLTTDHLLHQVELAAGAGKLSTGPHALERQVAHPKDKLLIVEKHYLLPVETEIEIDHSAGQPGSKSLCQHDAVDELIEKVLQAGGEVEIVADGVLSEYDHLAMIENY